MYMFVALGRCIDLTDIQLSVFEEAAQARVITDILDAIERDTQKTESLEHVVRTIASK